MKSIEQKTNDGEARQKPIRILAIDNNGEHLQLIKNMLLDANSNLTEKDRLFEWLDVEVYSNKTEDVILETVKEKCDIDIYLIDYILDQSTEEEAKYLWEKISFKMAKSIMHTINDETGKHLIFYTGGASDLDEERLKDEIPDCSAILVSFKYFGDLADDREIFIKNRNAARNKFCKDIREQAEKV